jgi:hypothetical protein
MMISQSVTSYNPYENFKKSREEEDTSQEQNDESQKADDVKELEQIDSEIRAHEAAHLGAGGGVVSGGANFTYTQGSDGKMYATAGEVPIDASEGKTPQETIQKAQAIRAAAMAPSDPSPQDYKVAASAVIMEMKAKQELQSMNDEQQKQNGLNEYAKVAAS